MLMSVKKALLIVSKFALTPSVVLTVSVNLDMSWMTLTEKRAKKVFIQQNVIKIIVEFEKSMCLFKIVSDEI